MSPSARLRQQVQSALRQVLGDGDRSAGGWVLSYGRDPSAPEAERDASVLMELIDPAAVRLAVRRIPAAPGDCGAIASAMAAVVERSLRTLGWTKGEPLPEAARRPSASGAQHANCAKAANAWCSAWGRRSAARRAWE